MKKIWLTTWLGLLPTTAALWFLPVPFQPTLMLVCGVMLGRLVARWI